MRKRRSTRSGPGARKTSVSKTQRKKESAELQGLGEALLELRPDELEAIDAPADVKAAVRDALKIRKHEALRRQRQYIGRLMRDVDPEPIRTFLAQRQAVRQQETRLFHEAEAWRRRLLAEGDETITRCATETGVDEDDLRSAVGDVRRAPTEPARKGASRTLFRLLHDHLVEESADQPD